MAASVEALLESLDDWWALAGVEVPPRPRVVEAQPTKVANALPISRAQPHAATPIAHAHTAAKAAAEACTTLDELEAAVRAFEGCALKAQARNTIFVDGVRGARVLVIGEAPGKEDDEEGKPFIGPAGQLLDRMLASIGLNRKANMALTTMIPWRPPGNRNPTATETAICLPFVQRHIELAKPDTVLLLGGIAAQGVLAVKDGILKLRRDIHQLALPGLESPVTTFAVFHPTYLLNRPEEKRLAWADLLRIEQHILLQGVALEPHF